MGHIIIKIKDRYFMYSTICDAPISAGFTRKDFIKWYLKEQRRKAKDWIEKELIEVDETGSNVGETMQEVILCNRAGERERHISAKKMYELYAHKYKGEL